MTKEIPTPETDAIAWVVAFGYQHLNEDVEVVDAEFARQLERERDEAQTKLKEAKELMNDAMWQLMVFLKPADTKTKNIIHALCNATDTMDNHTGR